MGDVTPVSEQPLDSSQAHWVSAGAADAVATGQATVIAVKPPVAVFNVDGEFFATDDTCTHEDASLADSFIEGEVVECWMHCAKFHIKTGAVLAAPATVPLRTYPIHVVDGELFVDLASREEG